MGSAKCAGNKRSTRNLRNCQAREGGGSQVGKTQKKAYYVKKAVQQMKNRVKPGRGAGRGDKDSIRPHEETFLEHDQSKK